MEKPMTTKQDKSLPRHEYPDVGEFFDFINDPPEYSELREAYIYLQSVANRNDGLLEALEDGQSKDWVANAGITNDIEALRKICLAYADWWNGIASPMIAKMRGQQ
jgi:hypothetical protein